MTLGQPVFDALEPKFTPLQVCPVRGVDLLNCDGCCYSLKLCTMHKPEKVGTVSLSSDNSGYDLASHAGSSVIIYPMFSGTVIFRF